MINLIFIFPLYFPLYAQQVEYNPVYGPKTVILGDNIAVINLPKHFIFLDKYDTRKFFEEIKEPYAGNELGIIFPQKDLRWFALFRYVQTGYIKDDEVDKLNPKELLQIIKENTEKANKERKKMGVPTIEVIDWYSPPHYDRYNHSLTWAIIGKQEDRKELVINYSSIILGRYGILSCTVVGEYIDASLIYSKMDFLVSSTKFTQGRKYEEWRQGDKIADITLTGLITGGTAAAAYGAAKTGLLAKMGKFLFKGILIILIPIIAFFRWLWRKFTAGK